MSSDLRVERERRYVPRNTEPGLPFRSVMATPIGRTTVGILYAAAHRPAAFLDVHVEVANAIASQIAIALEKAELFDQTLLFKSVDHLIFSHEDPDDVVRLALGVVFDELLRLRYAEVSAAQILFLIEGSSDLEIVHSTNPADIGVVVPIDDSVSGRAMTQRETIIVNDVAADPQYKRMLGRAIQSEIVVPIMVGPQELPIGVLNVESTDPDAFHGAYQVLLERFAHQVATLLAFAKLRGDVASALEMRHANELLVAVGDQTSNMVHKLNNTVGAMRVMVKEVQTHCADEVASNDFLRTSLEQIAAAAETTLEMPRKVQRFLAQASDVTEVDVNDCIEQALTQVTVPIGVTIVTSLAPNIPRVACFSLDLVLDNLIRNAMDAMPDGGTLEVNSRLVTYEGMRHGRTEINVSDSGVGMSDATRRKLFDIDFTTKPRRDGKGLGLGLWWVKHWVRRSQGEIDVQTNEGAGSTFTIKLPLVLPERP